MGAARHRPPTPDAHTIVVGAGPAGLACVAQLRRLGVEALVLEKERDVGSSWRRHYDRLHLHTPKARSSLPGLQMPASYPKYPSRDAFVAYLDAYAAHHRIAPRFGSRVRKVERQAGWTVETQGETFSAANVVFATGIAGWPERPQWPGIDGFPGRILHSSSYVNASPFSGSRVLVVGLGNSGGEIALDLAESGVDVTVSVRGPVNVVTREVLGIAISTWAVIQSGLPPRMADALSAPLRRMAIGDLRKFGLSRPALGPLTQVARERKIPLIDTGAVDRIRRGLIRVRSGIERISGRKVLFSDAAAAPFDAIILATGYRPDLRSMLPHHQDMFDASGTPTVSGRETPVKGLFFCGYLPVATGQLREIGIEAGRIARAIRSSDG